MDRKPEQHILLFVAAFYIVVAVTSVGLLKYGDGYFMRVEMEEQTIDKITENDVPEAEPETPTSPDEVSSTEEAAEEEVYPGEEEAEPPVSVEEEPVEEAEEETGYYEFIASNSAGRLNVRKEPTVKAKIIYRLHIGDKGYVLDIGDEWSHVSVSGNEGYCANEYLSLREVEEEDFPEELRSLVGQSPFPEED